MVISRIVAMALGSVLLVGAVGDAHADRNRYTQLRPGQAYPYYRHVRRPFGPYAYYGGGPGFAYGYGYRYRPRYGYGGYGYGPDYGGYAGPY